VRHCQCRYKDQYGREIFNLENGGGKIVENTEKRGLRHVRGCFLSGRKECDRHEQSEQRTGKRSYWIFEYKTLALQVIYCVPIYFGALCGCSVFGRFCRSLPSHLYNFTLPLFCLPLLLTVSNEVLKAFETYKGRT